MNTSTSAEVIDEVSKWGVGGGILTIALFPLALPIIALTAIALLPFLLVPLAAGLVAAIVVVPVLVARGLWRRATGAPRPIPGHVSSPAVTGARHHG
jgi:hypothetical protein